MIKFISDKLKSYWQLTKSLQTLLLLVTGITGYLSTRCPYHSWELFLLLIVSLYLSVSGTTVLNMIFDKDIDAKMSRTSHRPLPSKRVSESEALILAIILVSLGLTIAFLLSPLYGVIIFAGLFIDFIIYTVWLKQKTAWSIVWGGISGGMPILAGRVLGLGEVDMIGILLASAILFWIPTHIMTFNMRHFDDYNKASIPTFASKYGFKSVRIAIAASSILSAIAFCVGAFALSLAIGYMRILIVLAVFSMSFAIYALLKPSEKMNFRLFKVASIYMLLSMIIIGVGSTFF